tara:strand:- start:2186 stop:2443 length:258 start_codon:yes stop_codon:yes gene_type:complete
MLSHDPSIFSLVKLTLDHEGSFGIFLQLQYFHRSAIALRICRYTAQNKSYAGKRKCFPVFHVHSDLVAEYALNNRKSNENTEAFI